MFATRTFVPMAALAAVAMTFLQTAAFAGDVPMVATHRTAEVNAAGLNLANPADLALLDKRLQAAAKTVCAPTDYRDLRQLSDRASCQKAAIAAASARRDVLVARAQSDQLASNQRAPAGTN